MIEIKAIGGYDEVGRNCTAIKVDDEVIILDMGLHMERYIPLSEEEEDVERLNISKLVKAEAIPNMDLVGDWKKLVKAIIPTHAHLDHVGAIMWLEKQFNAPIVCTPFTSEIIKSIAHDEKMKIKNKIISVNPNSFFNVTDNIKVEFINITHSTPQTAMIAIHTKYGIIVYANDFKFDNSPVLGKRPNYEALRKMGDKGVLCLIVDSLYSQDYKKTPSEAVAREMLREIMLGTESKGKLIVVTTFSSHLARLKSIIEFGRILNRKIIMLGRSINKYVRAGEKIKIVNFSRHCEILNYSSKINKKLKEVKKTREKYLLIVTGHQGEPKSVLSRMVYGKFDFDFKKGDEVIFSCNVIPTETNKRNREALEFALKEKGVRIFKDVHVSGHCAREDQRDLLEILKPKHIIPTHGDKEKRNAMAELAYEMGWKKEFVHIIKNGDVILI